MNKRILRIDGCAGLIAGLVVWTLSDTLVALYQIPAWLLSINIIANIVYGMAGSLLASWPQRSIQAIMSLSIANLLWAVMCLITAVLLIPTASLFGVGHFVIEGLFVGTLGVLEWRWRNQLV
jgi:hypothetical protein